jgi:hypothetical protein
MRGYATLLFSYFYLYSLFDQLTSLLIISFFLCTIHLPSLFLFTLLSLFSILIILFLHLPFSFRPPFSLLPVPPFLSLYFYILVLLTFLTTSLVFCLFQGPVSSPGRLFPVSCLPSVLSFSSL